MAQMQGSTGSASYGKCMHSGCKCEVAPGKRYCSEYCEQQRGSGPPSQAGCGCGHAACKRS
jgi:hypothetical protein